MQHKGNRSQAVLMAQGLSIRHIIQVSAAGLLLAALWASPARPQTDTPEPQVIVAHGYSFYGDLSYPPDFEHFNYVNPDAPKGGNLHLVARDV